MKRLFLFISCIVIMFMLSGCTIKTDETTADNFGGVLEWLGFKRCEGKCE